MNISVPCEITPKGDKPLVVNGQIPYFSDYRKAYDYLANKRIVGVVCEGDLAVAEERFGCKLTPASMLV